MIETAKYEDVKTIIKLSLNIYNEHGFDNLPEVDIKKVTEFFYDRFSKWPILVYRDEKTKEILGFIGTEVSDFWWSSGEVLSDYIFYVRPEYRDRGIADELVKGFRDLGKLNKLPVVSLVFSNDRTEAKERFYRKHGLKKTGIMFTSGI